MRLASKTFFSLFIIFLSFKTFGSPSPVSLKEAINILEGQNPEVIESKIGIDVAEADIGIIKGKFRPKFEVYAGVGPINKAYGDAINSRNSKVTKIGNWRALYLVKVNGNLPLYTWGQNEDYLSAARNNIQINQEALQIKKNELRLKLKEAYYGNLLAANSLDFIKEGINDIEGATKKVKNKKSDLYRLNIFKNFLLSKKEEVLNSYDMSLAGMNYFIGEKDFGSKKPKEEWLELESRELNELDYYLNLLFKEKPELIQLDKGIEAKNLLARATKKGGYPAIGILLNYEFSTTDARESQNSVYAYDPYNENSLIVGVGFKWNIDFGVTKHESNKHSVESLQLEAKKKSALSGLELLVKNNWNEIKSLEKRLKSAKAANRYSKKLLSRSMIGGAVGLIDAKDVVEAYQSRILTFKEYFQTVFDYNVAWAKLSHSVGIEVDPLLVRP